MSKIFQERIDAQSGVRIPTSAASGKVATSNANGDIAWQAPALGKAYPLVCSARIAGGVGAATRLMPASGTTVSGATATTTVIPVFRLVAADLALTGVTAKLRVLFELLANATAPAATFTAGLYPLASVAGAANLLAYTVGTVISGSTAAIATPSASSVNTANSGVFSLPADGAYIFAVANDATTAASAEVHMTTRLEVSYV